MKCTYTENEMLVIKNKECVSLQRQDCNLTLVIFSVQISKDPKNESTMKMFCVVS